MRRAHELRHLLLALGVAAAAASAAPSALGAPFLETFGSPTSPMPFSARALATGSEATYFNPALLTHAEPGIQLGFFAVRQSLDIDLWDRPPGADITSKVYDARRLNPDGTTSRLERRPLPTESLRQGRGSVDPSGENLFVVIGTVVPLLEDRIAMGLHVVLPTRSFQSQRVAFSDEREQYFSNSLHYELYGDRFETNLISLALASRPFDGLSLGVGATAARITGLTDGEVYVVQRDIHALDGVVQGDLVDGLTEWSVEQVVLGSDNPILDVQTVSTKSPNAKASHFRSTRVSPSTDCSAILAQRDPLFAR